MNRIFRDQPDTRVWSHSHLEIAYKASQRERNENALNKNPFFISISAFVGEKRALTPKPSLDLCTSASVSSKISGSQLKLGEIEPTRVRLLAHFKSNPNIKLKAARDSPGMTQELNNDKAGELAEKESGDDLFDDMKQRFLSFKKHNYLKKVEHFASLAQAQAPKFLVIACADSRVCPSNILGFQPGEAFMVRNVANLVPPFERGPTETNAAMEFAVNTLEVENILIIGHSCCGGIRALMSMKDDEEVSSGLIKSWVVVGKKASLRAKATASNHDFDTQCTHCEKESINNSLLNLLTYPWIEERVRKGVLSLHGGYYDFVNCTFEKWTMDQEGSSFKEETGFAVINRSFWR